VRSLWLRSVRIDAAQAAPRLVIEGSGRGHGVGLCQWGARFFAASGASAADIVGFYFPGTALTNG
jgi:stage II sporulation protein D